MAKNIIILGAGASAEYGAPVMRNFLDVASRLFSTGKCGKRSESFRRVFEAISELQAVHSKAEFDLINLESVFTAFELAKTLQKFPGVEADGIDQLIEDLKWVIVTTLQESVQFPVNGKVASAPGRLIKLIKAIRSQSNSKGVLDTAILTFNYDLLIDIAAYAARVDVDYGLAGNGPLANQVTLLKLHGSLNWTTNSETGEVIPWHMNQYFRRFRLSALSEAKKMGIPIGDHLSQYGTDLSPPVKVDGNPVIVPPSWNKADSHRTISNVWSRAAAELSDAESIFVLGYSLPETDSFFRQLYALGSVGTKLLQKFWVFDPDSSRESVFKSLLGPGARERYRFFEMSFDKAASEVIKALDSASRQ